MPTLNRHRRHHTPARAVLFGPATSRRIFSRTGNSAGAEYYIDTAPPVTGMMRVPVFGPQAAAV